MEINDQSVYKQFETKMPKKPEPTNLNQASLTCETKLKGELNKDVFKVNKKR